MVQFRNRAAREAIDAALSFARAIPRSEVYMPSGVAESFRGTELEAYPHKYARDFSVVLLRPSPDTGIFNGESLNDHPLILAHKLTVLPGRETAYMIVGEPDSINGLLGQVAAQMSAQRG